MPLLGMIRYSHHPSLHSGRVEYTLEAGALTVVREKTSDKRAVDLGDVRYVRLTKIQGQGLCTLQFNRAPKVVISSRDFTRLGEFDDLADPYHEFVLALHTAISSETQDAQFVAGTNFGLALGVISLVMLALGAIAFAVSALASPGGTSFPTGALAVAFIACVSAVSLVRMGPAKSYSPDAIPEDLFPQPGVAQP